MKCCFDCTIYIRNLKKKSQELSSIVENLKEAFDLPGEGALPERCNGSRWISHRTEKIREFLVKSLVLVRHRHNTRTETN